MNLVYIILFSLIPGTETCNSLALLIYPVISPRPNYWLCWLRVTYNGSAVEEVVLPWEIVDMSKVEAWLLSRAGYSLKLYYTGVDTNRTAIQWYRKAFGFLATRPLRSSELKSMEDLLGDMYKRQFHGKYLYYKMLVS